MRSPRRIALVVALVVTFLTPSLTREQVPAPTRSVAQVSEMEYAIFSAYITDAFLGPKGEDRVGGHVSNIVIIGGTRSDLNNSQIEDEKDKPLSWKKASRFLGKEAPTLQQTTIEKLRAVGTQSVPFRPSFRLPVPYQLVDAKEIDAIFENKGWWTDYYPGFPI